MKRLLSFILVFFLSFSLFASDKTFALVLSGGGAKGIAHIEVIKELDKRGIHPDYVIGTSIGALIGAFYASGYSGEDLERLITENDLPELFKHLYTRSGSYIMEGGTETPVSNILSIDFSKNDVGSANGIIDDQYVASFFRSNLVNVLDVRNFDDLSIPYRAIGTDLETGEEIIYSQGSLYDAMRGSMAIPIVFTPARTGDGRYVVDGGMVNNLPTDVARDLGADIVLAVDLNDVLKEHTEGKVYYDIDTLTGLTFQVLDLVTGPNAAERYPLADYVIVPDLAEIGTMDFGRADEILAIGRAAVEDNISVFDEIEEALKRDEDEKVPESYFAKEPFIIKAVLYSERLNRYATILESFEGRRADYETALAFEDVLMYIKKEEGLKSVGYEVYDGVLVIEIEEFSNLSSSLSIGLNLDMGVKGGIARDSGTLFYFMPHFSAFFDIGLPSDYGSLIIGLDIKNNTALFASYYYDFDNSFSAFASARVGSGDISMLSIPDRIDRMDTSDFIFSLEGGVAYDYLEELRMEFSVDFDLISLGSVKSLDPSRLPDRGRALYADPKLNFNLKYHMLNLASLHDDGINVNFDANIYLRAPFMYTLSLSFESIIPSPIASSKFYINGELSTLRGNENIGESYRTNKSGLITRDYILLELGGRVVLTEALFMDVGFFSEFYEENKEAVRLWTRDGDYNLIPFAMLNSWDLGFSMALGYRTSVGDFRINVNITHLGTFSIGIGLT